jgi:thymidylate synthase
MNNLASTIHELLWYLKGDTNIRYLKANGIDSLDGLIDPDTAVYEDMSLIERLKAIKTKEQLDTVVCWIDCYTNTVAGENEVALTYDAVIDGAVVTEEFSRNLHDLLDIHDVDLMRLVAGDLRPTLGSLWRKWDDTRVILQDQYPAFSKNGYIWIGNIEITGKEEPRCVVSREIDQIANLIKELRSNPDSRRLILMGWNPAQSTELLPVPQHTFLQFYTVPLTLEERIVENTTVSRKLHCSSIQDSPTITLLTTMLAQVVNMIPGATIPSIELNPEIKDIFEFTFNDITITNFEV